MLRSGQTSKRNLWNYYTLAYFGMFQAISGTEKKKKSCWPRSIHKSIQWEIWLFRPNHSSEEAEFKSHPALNRSLLVTRAADQHRQILVVAIFFQPPQSQGSTSTIQADHPVFRKRSGKTGVGGSRFNALSTWLAVTNRKQICCFPPPSCCVCSSFFSFSATSTHVDVFTMMLVNLKEEVQLKSTPDFPSPKTTTTPVTT